MKRRIFFLQILFASFIIAGCTSDAVVTAKNTAIKGVQKTNQIIKESGEGYVRNLTDEQKQIIDQWLSDNKLNEYGDELDTVYPNGTPLFNGTTDEYTDRFEYLFEKFPTLKDVIKEIKSNTN